MGKPILEPDSFPQPFWRRKPVIAVSGALLLLVVVFVVLLVKKKPQAPAPVPVPKPPHVSNPQPPPIPSSATLKIPNELGGEVQSASVAKLFTLARRYNLNPGYLRLRMAGQPRGSSPWVEVGKDVAVMLASSHPCFYAVFHTDSSGLVQLFYPQMLMQPNTSAKLTNNPAIEASGTVDPPGGEQTFLLVCADKPINLESVLTGDPQTYNQSFAAAVLPYLAQENHASGDKK